MCSWCDSFLLFIKEDKNCSAAQLDSEDCIQLLEDLGDISVHVLRSEFLLSCSEGHGKCHALHCGRDRHSFIDVEQLDIAHIFARRADLLFYLRAGDLLVHDKSEVAGDVEELGQRLKCRRLSAERIQSGQIQFHEVQVRAHVLCLRDVISEFADIADLLLPAEDVRRLVGMRKAPCSRLVCEFHVQRVRDGLRRAFQSIEALVFAKICHDQVISLVRIFRQGQGLRNEDLGDLEQPAFETAVLLSSRRS